MALLDPFNINLTNSYAGDAFSELVRTYNHHTHSLATSNNFLSYNLDVNYEVGFVGISAIADPFKAIGAPSPLKIVAIGSSQLTLSRPATATTNGTLSYVDPTTNQFKLISGLIATEGLSILKFDLALNRSGLINSAFVDLSLARYVVTAADLTSNSTVSAPPQTTTGAYTVDLYPTGNYFIAGTVDPTLVSIDPNPTLVLTRGRAYTFALTAGVLSGGGFTLVSDLCEPKEGLKPYTLGVSTNIALGIISFIVPNDAPAQLFYQSRRSPYTYGEIQVVGGTIDAISATQVNQGFIAVPTIAPDRLLCLTLSSLNPYRIVKWEVFPDWTTPNSPGSFYMQLQARNSTGNPIAISQLVTVDTVDTTILTEFLIAPILAEATSIFCAVYAPTGINSLTQQLTILDLIDL